ncbi:hypothetical protein MSM1_03865 [Mycobacterium sp. SM1]|uniref:hypothetical protein n=1 Tax=Mycobacterium sp. SM1 TaxID=2816243 RepID=UPI001BCEBD7E|nr:hypothetical protein [Mycobacterium sp. SM1]MBS4727524.1 hypothetical protein [Mycobacterium sp. SM1]
MPGPIDQTLSSRRDTHLLKYDGGVLVSQLSNADRYEFANPLHRFNGVKPWALGLAPLPPGMDYADMVEAGIDSTEYLQAAGSDPKTIMVEIRKPGGQQWAVEWVRYAVGHPHQGDKEPAAVAVKLPVGTYTIPCHEVFDADEATELFWTYYKTGDIPDDYSLRPIEGYTTDGAIFDLRDGTPRMVYAGKKH